MSCKNVSSSHNDTTIITTDKICSLNPKGLILSGGPASVHKVETPRAPDGIFTGDLGIPILGICYGQQTMVQQMGGQVTSSDHREFGRASIKVIEKCILFEDVWAPGGEYQVWMSHGDQVEALDDSFDMF